MASREPHSPDLPGDVRPPRRVRGHSQAHPRARGPRQVQGGEVRPATSTPHPVDAPVHALRLGLRAIPQLLLLSSMPGADRCARLSVGYRSSASVPMKCQTLGAFDVSSLVVGFLLCLHSSRPPAAGVATRASRSLVTTDAAS